MIFIKLKKIIFYSFLFLFNGWFSPLLIGQTILNTYNQSTAGGSTQSSDHTLIATVGQLSPPETATSGQHTLYSGFIYTLGSEPLSIELTAEEPNANEALQIVATISPQQNVAQATILYREGGEQNFSSQAMTTENENFVVNIPANDLTSRGLEYFIVATDLDGVASRAPASGVISLPVNVADPGAVNTNAQPSGSAQTAYRLVSFPLDLTNKGPAAILTDDLGGYDKTKWRFFELRGDQQYYEFPDISDIKPGEGFWLIVKASGKSLDSGAGKTIITNKTFSITLETGWTFVGNPFDFAIPLSNLALKSGQALDIRDYQGAWNNVTGSIQPFEGYAVANNNTSEDTLFIDPYLYPVSGRLGKVMAATQEADLLWSINIRAQCQAALDVDNMAAVAKNAAHDWDELDRPEPPVIGEYVSLSFPHRDWEKPLKFYCTDARPEPVTGDIWQFEVRTNIRDKVNLIFEGLDDIPPGYEVWLVDEAARISQNLRDNNSYSVAVSGEDHPKQLKLLVGCQGFIGEQVSEFQLVPDKYELSQNFPNPFNPTTTIRYGLPKEGKVTLKIYNMLGEEVVTLLKDEEKTAGYHVVIWNARNQQSQKVANGIYVYQLRIDGFSLIKKMILIK